MDLQFTGSDRVGKILASEAAKYLKPCVLELGGKAPAVVSAKISTSLLVSSWNAGTGIKRRECRRSGQSYRLWFHDSFWTGMHVNGTRHRPTSNIRVSYVLCGFLLQIPESRRS